MRIRSLAAALAATLLATSLVACTAAPGTGPSTAGTTPPPSTSGTPGAPSESPSQSASPQTTPSSGYPFTLEQMPRIDGSTANIPLISLVIQRLTGVPAAVADNAVKTSGTPVAYQQLGDKSADLLIVYEADEDTKKSLAEQKVKFEYYPIGRDALVFFTNSSNPVTSLTTAQYKDIYTGKLTNWKQVGGNNEKIIAFQRPQNSGSQTIMEAKVMQGRPMATPLKEESASGMGDILSSVADYRNSPGAIGYSFRWYATVMNAKAGLKLLSIDGVAPSVENIRNGSYPFTVDVHAVTAGTTNPNVPKLLDWVRSAEGQALIEQVGYVGLS